MVRFDSGSATVPPQGKAILDNFGIPYLRWRLTSPVTVQAWTDTVGSRAANMRLSLRRGEAVRSYLAQLGIPKVRIRIVAHGEDHAIVATPDETPNPNNRAASVVEDVGEEEMARRKAAWAAFPALVC
jgi:OOP family OmpA-OmpF porin